MLRRLFLPLCLIVVTGCAALVSGLQHDKSFNYNPVKTGGSAVGGVTTLNGQASKSELNYYRELYRREIVEERSKLRLVPVGNLMNRLGESYALHAYATRT